MPREITVALVQMAPALANPEANLRKMGDFVEKICSEQKTDLIVFPELSYTGTELGLRATDLAERVPGHASNYLAKRANDFNTHVVFGLVVKEKVEVARSLTLEGAELVVISANWEQQFADSWRAHLISRACENSIFVAAANRIGEEPTMRFSGDSMLVGPSAEVYTVLDEPIEGYAIATIDLDQVRKVREDRQLIQYREPVAYRSIVRKY